MPTGPSSTLMHRLIPVILLRNGMVVQSKGFSRYQKLGNPTAIVKRLSNWASDELIYLDISREPVYDLGRDDLGVPNRHTVLEILRDVSRECFMPLTFGGGIRTVDDALARIAMGADKIAINTQALRTPSFVTECAKQLGSQAVVVCMDFRSDGRGGWDVYAEGGRVPANRKALDWAKEAERLGAGELLLQSIDRDGAGLGYDLDLIRGVVEAVRIPVIALGGAGEWTHLGEALSRTGVGAVAAANVFAYMENSVYHAKKYLFDRGFNVRSPSLHEFHASGA